MSDLFNVAKNILIPTINFLVAQAGVIFILIILISAFLFIKNRSQRNKLWRGLPAREEYQKRYPDSKNINGICCFRCDSGNQSFIEYGLHSYKDFNRYFKCRICKEPIFKFNVNE